MERLKCVIQYDGTNYSGFQIQPNGVTIQGKIEQALTKMHKGEHIRVIPSGRTDKGVHAMGQVIHFDTTIQIEAFKWKRALQTLLPADIKVKSIEKAEKTFHAQHDTIGKEYRYFVLHQKETDIFRRHYTYHVPFDLDVAAIQEACTYVLGTHDFTSFCSMKTHIKGEKVRTISEASCIKEGNELIFTFKGDGFLYNMVRILVGTFLAVGKGYFQPEDVREMLEAKDRTKSGMTAPANGLFLWDVLYE